MDFKKKKRKFIFNNFFDMNKKKINFKKFAVLNAYLLKSILIKNSQIKLKLNGLMILLFEGKKICEFTRNHINAEKIFNCRNRNKY